MIPLSGARVALVVGDIVGHGIHASAAMGRLRTAVRTLADVDLAPDELLAHLDDLVIRLGTGQECADVPPGELGATCLYAVYDPVSRRCSLADAGHPWPALVTPDGTVDFIELPTGPPLGLGGLPFECVETELPEGSLLALYTDGLIEARGRDVDTGLSTLRTALATAAAPRSTPSATPSWRSCSTRGPPTTSPCSSPAPVPWTSPTSPAGTSPPIRPSSPRSARRRPRSSTRGSWTSWPSSPNSRSASW